MDIDLLFSPRGPLAQLLPGFLPHPDLRALATSTQDTVRRRERLLVEAPALSDRLLAALLPVLDAAPAFRGPVLITTAQQETLDTLEHCYVPLLEDLVAASIPFVRIDDPEDYAKLEPARQALVIAIPYHVLAWHLRIAESTDLELLPMPAIVLMEDTEVAAGLLRQHLGFQLSVHGLQRTVQELPALGFDALHDQLQREITRFGQQLAEFGARARSPRDRRPVRLELRGLIALLEQVAALRHRVDTDERGALLRMALAARCRAAIDRLQLLEHADDTFEFFVSGSAPERMSLRADRKEISAELACGLLDHASSVIALGDHYSVPCCLAAARLELGLYNARELRIPNTAPAPSAPPTVGDAGVSAHPSEASTLAASPTLVSSQRHIEHDSSSALAIDSASDTDLIPRPTSRPKTSHPGDDSAPDSDLRYPRRESAAADAPEPRPRQESSPSFAPSPGGAVPECRPVL